VEHEPTGAGVGTGRRAAPVGTAIGWMVVNVDAPVLVIGAGIGGLATALALERVGLPVAVYERAPELQEVGAGIGLWPNAIRVLDRIGAGEDVRELAVPGTSATARTSSGRVLLGIPEEQLHERYGAPTTGIMRAQLQLRLAERFGIDRVHVGHELASFTQDRTGVRARFVGGDEVHGSALVGADGLRSVVRAGLLDDGPPRYRGDTAWRGLAPITDDLHPMLEFFETVGRGERFGIFPMHGRRVMWFASAVRPEGERDGPDVLGAMQARFAGWHDPIPRVLELTDPDSIIRNDIYDRRVSTRWVGGRVALLGDAAHPMGPDLGQGACQAIEDAETLALALAHHADVPTALSAYQRIRVPRVRTVARIVAVTAWLAARTSPAACTLRDTALRLGPPAVADKQLELLAGWDPPAQLRAAHRPVSPETRGRRGDRAG
jgi:FAD-dependent urate hydroxylase